MMTTLGWQRTKCIAALVLTFVLILPSFANEAVDKAVAAEMQRQNIPGVAVAVIQNGKVVKVKGYGLANVELNVPVTTETAFKIGSISKPMIAIGVMKLVEEGKIKLDDRVSKYFPDVPEAWKDITIKHLLSHTSGILREAPAFDPFKIQTDYDVIKSAFTEPLVFQPGERYQYCNVGYFSLADIISRVSGKPWPQYLDEVLFRPNKMLATRVTSNTEIIANRASGYAFRGKLSNEESFRALRPSGAFYSSIADMVSWALSFESGITIKKDTIRSMWKPVRLKDGKNAPYGFGWAVGNLRGKNVVGHGGSLSGFRSDLTMFEDDKLMVIVLTNLSTGQPAAISMAVADVFIDFPRTGSKAAYGQLVPFSFVAKQILPNSTIGVFGSGQLGRMFAIEARQMGYRVHTFSPESDTPTGQVADIETCAGYDDLHAVRTFAQSVDLVTFEFENVPAVTVDAAAEFVNVFPKGEILHTTQNRLREKTFLSSNAFPITPFRHITSLEGLRTAVSELGTPCVLKTAGFGYDGKGQSKITSTKDIDGAFAALNGAEAVLEVFVAFAKEVSVVCARDQAGNFAHYGVIENEHANHILDVSFAPAIVSREIHKEAGEIARNIADTLGYVGTLCVEFFVSSDGKLLVNELAPRPHNSGHLTFDACVTSQFEQQLRAVCGLPLGSTEFYRPAAMANLLGDVWANGEPNWAAALAIPDLKVHLYGKQDPKPGRKMGHICSLADTPSDAVSIVRTAAQALVPQN